MNVTAFENQVKKFNPAKPTPKVPEGKAMTKSGNLIDVDVAIKKFIDMQPNLKEQMRKYLIVFGKDPNGATQVLAERLYGNRAELHHKFKKKVRPTHINKESFDHYLTTPVSTYDFEQFEAEVEKEKGFEGFDSFDESFEPLESFGLQDIGILAKGAKNLIGKIGKKGHDEKQADSDKKSKKELEKGEDTEKHAKRSLKESGASDEDIASLDKKLQKHTDKILAAHKVIESNTVASIKENAAKIAQDLQKQKIDTINALNDTMKDNKISDAKGDQQKMIMYIVLGVIVVGGLIFFLKK